MTEGVQHCGEASYARATRKMSGGHLAHDKRWNRSHAVVAAGFLGDSAERVASPTVRHAGSSVDEGEPIRRLQPLCYI
jgi:hypothetical protein